MSIAARDGGWLKYSYCTEHRRVRNVELLAGFVPPYGNGGAESDMSRSVQSAPMWTLRSVVEGSLVTSLSQWGEPRRVYHDADISFRIRRETVTGLFPIARLTTIVSSFYRKLGMT